MKYFLTLLFVFIYNITNAQALSKEQAKQVTIVVEAYKQNLIAYSISGGKDNIKLFERIKSYFPDPLPGDAHVLDFGDLPEGGAENTDLETYLNKIADDYQNKLTTVFTSGKILNCILEEENKKAAVYLINKTMNYNGKFYVATDVILISLPEKLKDNKNYKILNVQSATFFMDRYKKYNCANMVDVRNSDQEKVKMLKEADTLFLNELKPEQALIKYIHISERYPNDNYVKKMMDTCINSIQGTLFFVKRGDSLLKSGDLPQALYWYRWHQKIQAGKNPDIEVEEKIKTVMAQSGGLLYAAAKNKSEKAFNDKNWPEARFYVEQALVYKPNDTFALDLLKNVKNYDETEYSREIANATRMFNADDKANAGEYYRILKKHDTYHSLTMIQYMKMCLILFTDRGFIKKGLKMTDDEIDADLKTYCKKLSDSLGSETDQRLLRTAEILLENVISFKNSK